ncbi:MAG: hypothetical protein JO009_06190, partial [Candidatus Eremiobacteraeota bacterium]|nr:hypothetical protein [Candidatus Eremiobacteraeota bacterium]
INNGHPLVTLAPNAVMDVPITVKQNAFEPVGTRHKIRVIAASPVTFKSITLTGVHSLHNELHGLGGDQFQVAVELKTRITCSSTPSGGITGTIVPAGPIGGEPQLVYVTPAHLSGGHVTFLSGAVLAQATGGKFRAALQGHGIAACLYAGSTTQTSAGSPLFSY